MKIVNVCLFLQSLTGIVYAVVCAHVPVWPKRLTSHKSNEKTAIQNTVMLKHEHLASVIGFSGCRLLCAINAVDSIHYYPGPFS